MVRWEPWIATAVAGTGLAYLAITFGSLRVLARTIDHAPRAFVDFIYVFYPAGRAVLDSGDVVQGFFYTPLFALLMAPLAQLPGPTALTVWIGLQLAAAVALAWLGLRLVPDRPPGLTTIYAAVFVLCFPIVHGFSWGQVSGPLAALSLGAVLAHRGGRWARAGGLLSLAASVKYFPLALAVCWIPAPPRRSLLALLVGMVFLLGLVPVVFFGLAGAVDFYVSVAEMMEGSAEVLREDPNSQHVTNVVQRWFTADRTDDGTSPELVLLGRAVGLGGTGLLLALAMAAGWRRVPDATVWGAALVLSSTPFWIPTSWPHYFVYLPFVQLLVAADALRPGAGAPRRLARVAALTLAGGSALLSSVPAFLLLGGKSVYGPAGALFAANLLVLAGTLIQLLPKLTATPRSA